VSPGHPVRSGSDNLDPLTTASDVQIVARFCQPTPLLRAKTAWVQRALGPVAHQGGQFGSVWGPRYLPGSGVRGRSRRRSPVAANMALAIAGAMVMMGVSPAPAGSMSSRFTRTTSMGGTSGNRGTL